MSSSTEGLSGISQLCGVSRVCTNDNIRVVEELMWELEGRWDSVINVINKYHWRLTLGTGQYLMPYLEFGLAPYSTHHLYWNWWNNGCLAYPPGLINRHNAIRKLESSRLAGTPRTAKQRGYVSLNTTHPARDALRVHRNRNRQPRTQSAHLTSQMREPIAQAAVTYATRGDLRDASWSWLAHP